MSQVPMYPTVPGKPYTKLAAPYHAGQDTQIIVADATQLPAAPNRVTIEREDKLQFVTVDYETKTGNTLGGLTITEGKDTPSLSATYPAESDAYRALCSKDIEEMQENIRDGGGGIQEIPIASEETLGGVKVGSGLNIEEDGTLKTEPLSIASPTILGGVKVGDTLTIDNNGVLNAKEQKSQWGWDIDMSLSSPTSITYVGELFGKTQAQRASFIDDNFLAIAVVKNGVEQYLLNKANWNQKAAGGTSNITGTDGDVMLRIKKLYTRHYMLPSLTGGGRVLCFRASDEPFEGAKARAHTWLDEDERSFLYLGCFEGTADGAGTALLSVYSTTATPVVSKTIDAFRAMTTATVKGGKYYGIMNMNTKTLWNDLYLCIYGNRNAQAACGNGLVGLSAASPVGVAAILTSGMTYGSTANNTTHVKVMHTVNSHGNVWEDVDGFIMFDYRAYINPHAGGMINLYPSNVAVTEAAVQAAGYEVASTEALATSGQYVTEVSGNDLMPYLPTKGGGATTTHFCDYYWVNSGARIAVAGGRWYSGATCGAFFLGLDGAPSAAGAHLGARLQMLSAV